MLAMVPRHPPYARLQEEYCTLARSLRKHDGRLRTAGGIVTEKFAASIEVLAKARHDEQRPAKRSVASSRLRVNRLLNLLNVIDCAGRLSTSSPSTLKFHKAQPALRQSPPDTHTDPSPFCCTHLKQALPHILVGVQEGSYVIGRRGT